MTSENVKKATSATRSSANGSGGYAGVAGSWDQSRPDQRSAKEPLAASKLAKNEAEYARQSIANEILEAAKTVCGELIADTERTLEKARYLESEADRKHVEAHEERERAAEIRMEAEDYRETLIEDAKRQSLEQIERARATAERECSEMKKRASIESEKMLAQAQVMRAAALEELEAQKIYAEAARFKAASQETLDQARNRLDDARTSALLKPAPIKPPKAPAPAAKPVKTNPSDPETDPAGHQGQIDRATALALQGIGAEAPAEAPETNSDGALDTLEELRNMQEAASKAVDAALAEERKPTSQKRTTRRKKATTKKS